MAAVVTLSGPLFESDPFGPVSLAIRDEVAADVLAVAHGVMDAKFVHPTPYYETQVTNEVFGTERIVHDRGVVYGPWLEGTSWRNRVSTFKGYHAFSTAARTANARVQETASAVLRRWFS